MSSLFSVSECKDEVCVCVATLARVLWMCTPPLCCFADSAREHNPSIAGRCVIRFQAQDDKCEYTCVVSSTCNYLSKYSFLISTTHLLHSTCRSVPDCTSCSIKSAADVRRPLQDNEEVLLVAVSHGGTCCWVLRSAQSWLLSR